MKTNVLIIFLLLFLTISLTGCSTLEANQKPESQLAAESAQGTIAPGTGAGIQCVVQVDLTGAVCITKDGLFHRQDCPKLSEQKTYTTRDLATKDGYKPCPVCKP